MAKRRRKEVRRLPMGILVMGGSNYPPCAYQMYRIDYDDGTTETDRGLTLFTLPGIREKGEPMPADVRPDLLPHMRVVLAVQEDISRACWDLDCPKPKKKKGKKRG